MNEREKAERAARRFFENKVIAFSALYSTSAQCELIKAVGDLILGYRRGIRAERKRCEEIVAFYEKLVKALKDGK